MEAGSQARPAYFRHVMGATQGLFEKTNTKAADYDYFVLPPAQREIPARGCEENGH